MRSRGQTFDPKASALVVPVLAACLLSTAGAGCDKLKSSGSDATAAAAESDAESASDETRDSDDAPKKSKKKRAKKKATATDPGSPPPPPLVPSPLAPSGPLPLPTAPPAPVVNYFTDATSIPQKLQDRLGPTLRAYEISVYPEYAFAKLQDPKQPLHVDQYELRKGEVGAGTPVKFVGKEPTLQELANVTFDLTEPDWAKMPAMIADAPTRLKVSSPTVTHVTVRRPMPLDREVRFRVYVDGAPASGSVVYDTHGVMKKVYE